MLMNKSRYGGVLSTVKTKDYHVTMHTTHSSYQPFINQIEIKIKNLGSPYLYFDQKYRLEKYVYGTWYKIPFYRDVELTKREVSVPEGESCRQTIDLHILDHPFDEGTYRVMKRISTERSHSSKEVMVAARFYITTEH
ncbi:immunoglobulin-like domain-containing protein [Thalassobacillus sp. CUG 92003]|uniref:immunoglobulin-like domain-containing protein n=1 Tax=Thalassobacillus sp. CUG 92003 TaxID=2736641 RepID=UPI0015E69069|nr:immunoglobulin-like domain-containing protein [Thalassobacillus sp. CUG 92003]